MIFHNLKQSLTNGVQSIFSKSSVHGSFTVDNVQMKTNKNKFSDSTNKK